MLVRKATRLASALLRVGAVLWLMVFSAAAPASAITAKENLVKAAFIYNFTKFIEWPGASDIFEICVYDQPDFYQVLRKIEDRSTEARRFYVLDAVKAQGHSCHITLYDKGMLVKQFVPKRLTIGEGEEFVEELGAISFIEHEKRLRFIVNLKATREAGLKVNPQLLEVAYKVIQ